MSWADAARTMKVRANADTPLDARTARAFGAEGIGLCRTEHMFFEEERIAGDARDDPRGRRARARRARSRSSCRSSARTSSASSARCAGLPVTIRLLDPPLHEFLPTEPKQLEQLVADDGRPGAEARAAHEGPARVQPDARPPRLPPRHHVSRRSTRCRCAPSSRPPCSVGERGHRGAPRDHDPARDHARASSSRRAPSSTTSRRRSSTKAASRSPSRSAR